MKKKQELSLMEKIIKESKNPDKFTDTILKYYDEILPGRTKDRGYWDGVIETLSETDFWYYKNRARVKDIFKMHSYRYKWTGDYKEEPDTATYIMTWAKDKKEDKDNWIVHYRIRKILTYFIASFNCCDFDYTNKRKPKPSKEYWALRDESFIAETESFITLQLSFDGHYHS